MNKFYVSVTSQDLEDDHRALMAGVRLGDGPFRPNTVVNLTSAGHLTSQELLAMADALRAAAFFANEWVSDRGDAIADRPAFPVEQEHRPVEVPLSTLQALTAPVVLSDSEYRPTVRDDDGFDPTAEVPEGLHYQPPTPPADDTDQPASPAVELERAVMSMFALVNRVMDRGAMPADMLSDAAATLDEVRELRIGVA